MGKQSQWYFNFYVSFTVLFAVQWIYILVVTLQYGAACSKKCPLITMDAEVYSDATGRSLTSVEVESAAAGQPVTSYYQCDESHDRGFTG